MSKVTLSVVVFVLGMSVAVEGQAAGKRYLVSLRQPATVSTMSLQTASSAFEDVEAKVKSLLQKVKSVVRSEHLKNVHAMVIEATDANEMKNLKNDPNVMSVEEEVFYPLPESTPTANIPAASQLPTNPPPHIVGTSDFHSSSTTPWGIETVQTEEAWKDSNAGAGVRVMVLDTGIDKAHPSLVGSFEKGQNLLDDNIQPYPFFDKIGHGTHVSGTIAGQPDDSGFTGVAPRVKLLMGRVCSDAGCSSIGIVKGLEWAVKEKVDVVSMSLGGTGSTLGERLAMHYANSAGITVVAASGNEAAAKIDYPAALPEAIAVGAVDSKDVKAAFSNYGTGLAVVAPGVAVRSSVPQGTGRLSKSTYTIGSTAAQVIDDAAVAQGSGDTLKAIDADIVDAGFGPADIAKVNVKGKIAFMHRGQSITFQDKANAAVKAGAIAVICDNNEAGGITAQLPTPIAIPFYTITQAEGKTLAAGLTAKSEVKMHLQMEVSDYATMDGTSMATPHVAGVVALIKAANRSLTPDKIREILEKTAKSLGPNDKNQYGSGLVNAAAAVKAAVAAGPNVIPALAIAQ